MHNRTKRAVRGLHYTKVSQGHSASVVVVWESSISALQMKSTAIHKGSDSH